MTQRTVFFISDGTAITAETFGHSLLTQFSGVSFKQVRLPFVDTLEKCREAVEMINRAADADNCRPLVFNTIVDPEMGEVLGTGNGHVLDMFGTFLGPLEEILGVSRSPSVGRAHGMHDEDSYEDRMEATNYALTHDDGMSTRMNNADLILVGVSRSGKTPTCLYMALHFGVKAANYPLTDDDLEQTRLPAFLRRHKRKLFGLTIDPGRLAKIREVRRPGSRYASLKQCRFEVETAEAQLRAEGVPMLSTTHSSIEEIASRILLELGFQRELF